MALSAQCLVPYTRFGVGLTCALRRPQVQLQSTVMSSLPGLGTGASAGTGHTLYKPASMQPSAGTLGLSGLEALQLNDAGGLVAAAGLTGLQHVQTGHGGAAGLDTGLGVGGLGLGGALPYRSLGGLAGLQSTMQTGVFDALGTGGWGTRAGLCVCTFLLPHLSGTCCPNLHVFGAARGMLRVAGWRCVRCADL